jgi:serine/threonine protein kinase
VIDKKEVDETRLRMEVEILKKVKHPNIISLKEVYDEDPKKLYLVMELVTGGELFNKIVEIGSYSENIAKRYPPLFLPFAFFFDAATRSRVCYFRATHLLRSIFFYWIGLSSRWCQQSSTSTTST